MDGGAVVVRTNRLEQWLRYDPSRIEEVEAAYQLFCEQSRMGLAFLLGIVGGLICGMWVMLAHLGQPPASYAGAMLVMTMAPFYGIPIMAMLRVDRAVIGTVLRGAVDPVRACIFAALLAIVIAPAQSAVVYVLLALHAKVPSETFDPLDAGILFGFALLVFVGPVVEEFLVQGWVQTKARGFGPRGSGVVATVVFVVLHAPTTLVELTRVFGLGTAAWLRGTTRSLAACIVLHAVANLFFCLMTIEGMHV